MSDDILKQYGLDAEDAESASVMLQTLAQSLTGDNSNRLIVFLWQHPAPCKFTLLKESHDDSEPLWEYDDRDGAKNVLKLAQEILNAVGKLPTGTYWLSGGGPKVFWFKVKQP